MTRLGLGMRDPIACGFLYAESQQYGLCSEWYESWHTDWSISCRPHLWKAGYYAVFAVVLGVIEFDFMLRLVMIEKRTAATWLRRERHNHQHLAGEETPDIKTPAHCSYGSDGSSTSLGSEQPDQLLPEPDETFSQLPRSQQKNKSCFSRNFPTTALLLGLPATEGCDLRLFYLRFSDCLLRCDPSFVRET